MLDHKHIKTVALSRGYNSLGSDAIHKSVAILTQAGPVQIKFCMDCISASLDEDCLADVLRCGRKLCAPLVDSSAPPREVRKNALGLANVSKLQRKRPLPSQESSVPPRKVRRPLTAPGKGIRALGPPQNFGKRTHDAAFASVALLGQPLAKRQAGPGKPRDSSEVKVAMAKFRRFSRKWVDNYGSIRHQGKLVAWLMAKPCVWLGSPGIGCALCANLVRNAQDNRISSPAAVKLSDDSEGTKWSRFEIKWHFVDAAQRDKEPQSRCTS